MPTLSELITGPPPSIDEMTRDLQAADAAGDTQLAQHIAARIKAAQPPESPLDTAARTVQSAVSSAGHEFMGLGDVAGTLDTMAVRALQGRPLGYQDAYADYSARAHADQAAHPIAKAAGGAAGGVAAMAATEGLSTAPKALEAGQSALRTGLNLARSGAVTGGVIAGGQGAATGNSEKAAGAALGGAATGAVLGTAVGGGAAGVARVVKPLATKTALALSKVFGESAPDMQAAWQTFVDNTGRAPTMAELATLKQRGQIANAAKDSSAISTTITQAADDAARARSDNMQGVVQQAGDAGPPAIQSSGQVANATTAQGDVDYPAARLHNFTIDTADSAALGGVSPADHLASEIVPLAGLKTADKVRIVEGLKTGALSGEDAQMLRSKLTKAQGQGSSYSPAIASAQEDLDDFLNAPGNETAAGALAHATANYTAGAQRGAGAAHGESVLGAQTADNFAAETQAKPNANGNFKAGVASGARSKLADTAATPNGAESLAGRLATDDSLHAKLATTFGQDTADALRRMGQSEANAADNMNALSRRVSPADDQTAKDFATVTRGFQAAFSHGVYQFYHGAKALAGLGMSPAVQDTVAKYLADPKMTQQGINLLRKAGATNAQLRQLALQAAQGSGALAGGVAGSVVTGQ